MEDSNSHRTLMIILVITFLFPASLTCNAQDYSLMPGEGPPGLILFMSTRDGNFDIYSMDPAGEKTINLTNHPALDYWASHDGIIHIFFYSKRDGNDEIYRMNMNGKDQVNISNHQANDRLPEYSQQSGRIVFLSDRDHPEGELYTMRPDGSDVRRITNNIVGEDVARWSPDGMKMIYAKDARSTADIAADKELDFELFLINHDGTMEKQITHFPGFCAAPVFSPDGKRIAFYGRGESGDLDIFTMKPNGKGLQNITKDTLEDYSPAWSPDGKWIAYTSGDISNYDIWIINLETGKRARLTTHAKRDETPIWIRVTGKTN